MEELTKTVRKHPSEQEIASALTRYNLTVRVLGQLIERIEERNSGSSQWFIFSEKVGKKYLNQCYTLQNIFADDIYIIKGEKKQRFIDFSSTFSLLRVQLETYAVFFHLFADKCDMEERIVRFRLWELDALQTRQKYSKPTDHDTILKLEKETKEIEYCIDQINQVRYFKNLDKRTQEYLLKYASWRFNSNSLRNKDNNKKRLSIEQMIMNTGLKETHFNDWYSYTSSHTHTSYWSVIQNDSLSEEDKITTEYVSIMQATFITSFFIKDFCRLYEVAKTFYNSLQTKEQEVINSFDIRGRNQTNNTPPP